MDGLCQMAEGVRVGLAFFTNSEPDFGQRLARIGERVNRFPSTLVEIHIRGCQAWFHLPLRNIKIAAPPAALQKDMMLEKTEESTWQKSLRNPLAAIHAS